MDSTDVEHCHLNLELSSNYYLKRDLINLKSCERYPHDGPALGVGARRVARPGGGKIGSPGFEKRDLI